DATLKNVRYPKLLRDLGEIARFALILLRRGARYDFEVRDLGQSRQDFLLNAFGKVSVRSVFAQVFERQHRDRFTVGGSCRSVSRNRRVQLRCLPSCREYEFIESKITEGEQEHDNNHAIHAPRGLWRDRFLGRHVLVPLQTLRSQFENPTENE